MPSLLGENPRIVPNKKNTTIPTGQGLLDAAALLTTPIPGIGDAMGLLSDANMIRNEPSWGNVGMAAAGLLPFVPAASISGKLKNFDWMLPKDDGSLIKVGSYKYDPDVAVPPKDNTTTRFQGTGDWSPKIPASTKDGVLYRGMSEAEYQNYLKTGEIKSLGRMNIGKAQEGLTYYSSSPGNASGYATGVSSFDNKSRGYVVAIKDPGTAVSVHGTSHLEHGIPGSVKKDDVIAVYEGVPAFWNEKSDQVNAFWRKISD